VTGIIFAIITVTCLVAGYIYMKADNDKQIPFWIVGAIGVYICILGAFLPWYTEKKTEYTMYGWRSLVRSRHTPPTTTAWSTEMDGVKVSGDKPYTITKDGDKYIVQPVKK